MENIDFTVFWKAYPRKEGKANAERKWGYLRREDKHQVMEDIKRRYVGKEMKFIPYGSTYLNQKRWEDDLPPKPRDMPKPASHKLYEAEERPKAAREVAENYLAKLRAGLGR